MSQAISGVLTKDYVFFGITDSHEDIIKQHRLHEGAGRVNIVLFEITPPRGDFSAPLEQWTYRRNQDVFPKWHDEDYDEFRASAALVNSGLAPLDADYEAKLASLDADYEAKLASLDADHEAKRAKITAGPY